MVSSRLITTATIIFILREMVIRRSRYIRLIQIALWWFGSEGSVNLVFLQTGLCFPCNNAV